MNLDPYAYGATNNTLLNCFFNYSFNFFQRAESPMMTILFSKLYI